MKYHNTSFVKSLKGLITASLVAAAGLSTASAAFITINTGVSNEGTDNVLFNDNTLQHSGLFVQGNFSGTGAGYVVRFTSSSGNGTLEGGGGQATVNGLIGNNPFNSLTFALENGATFTKAVLNPDSTANGLIDFSVLYINGAGSPFLETFSLGGNGSNFFNIESNSGAKIQSVTFSTKNTSFKDASQFRLGGFAQKATNLVPDGGATFVSLGVALLGLGSIRKLFAGKA